MIEVNTSPFIDNCQDYTNYIIEHKNNVIAAFEQIRPKIEAMLPSLIPALEKIISEHDKSKWLPDEYDAYADRFYRGTGTQKEFDRAWLLHIHRNPHHWQHWLLKEDNGNTKALDMPFIYIIEMICDWHSFSAKKPESTAFNWFKDNKYKMVLSEQTENDVTYFVQFLRDPLLKGDKK